MVIYTKILNVLCGKFETLGTSNLLLDIDMHTK